MKILRIRAPDNAYHYYETYPNETIGIIKATLFPENGFDIEKYTISLGDEPLNDDMLISDLPSANKLVGPQLQISLINNNFRVSPKLQQLHDSDRPGDFTFLVNVISSLGLFDDWLIKETLPKFKYNVQNTVKELMSRLESEEKAFTHTKTQAKSLSKLYVEFEILPRNVIDHVFALKGKKLKDTREGLHKFFEFSRSRPNK